MKVWKMPVCKLVLIPCWEKKYPTINPDLLGFKSGRHIIFYQILNKNEVDVIRILHEQMDIESKLGIEDY